MRFSSSRTVPPLSSINSCSSALSSSSSSGPSLSGLTIIGALPLEPLPPLARPYTNSRTCASSSCILSCLFMATSLKFSTLCSSSRLSLSRVRTSASTSLCRSLEMPVCRRSRLSRRSFSSVSFRFSSSYSLSLRLTAGRDTSRSPSGSSRKGNLPRGSEARLTMVSARSSVATSTPSSPEYKRSWSCIRFCPAVMSCSCSLSPSAILSAASFSSLLAAHCCLRLVRAEKCVRTASCRCSTFASRSSLSLARSS
mmetsp:Transcript_34262/g.76048  ORF Transcript_34262/g.76048 Transcript_34262/m.76048 type:complete len:254 (-) Transcript_34262:982-1743(-)